MKPSQTLITAFLFLLVSCVFMFPAQVQAAAPLDPALIPQWVNQITGPPPVYVPINVTDSFGNVIRQEYTVNVTQFTQQMLPTQDATGKPTGFGATTVFGYGGLAMDPVTGRYLGYMRSTPGPSFEAIRNVPIQVKWVNNLVDAEGKPLGSMFAVDPTIHWANPSGMDMPAASTAPAYPPGYSDAQSPVPIVTHLHGGEVPSLYDGNPDTWFTTNGVHGSAYQTATPTDANAAIYEYPNTQEPTTLWYHDHTLGMTRLNILSGLVGFYLLRDPADSVAPLMPKGQFDVPLVIQDRRFLSYGSLYYPSVGNNPEVHPYWNDAFLGNAIMVNGLVWPNLNVEQGLYRFRLLDASNSRFYQFRLSNGMNFTQIGTDGGYLKTAAIVNSLLLGPAERGDILIDFSSLPVGTKLVLQNGATIGSAEKQTVGQIMQFTVTSAGGESANALPTQLNPNLNGDWPTLQNVTKQRTLSLIEAIGTNGTLAMYLDGQAWDASVSEKPVLGSTEEWVIPNPTTSAHTIHLHLVQFQVVSRQTFNDTRYNADWFALNGQPPLNQTTKNLPLLTPYLTGESVPAAANEQGWKDTVQAFAGQVTIIRIRFTQQDGSAFPFDATVGPGYVWHCHLLEHEDNEMMRPYTLVSTTSSALRLSLTTMIVVVAVVAVIFVAAVAIVTWRRRSRVRSQRTVATQEKDPS